ncbi:uncharacterized protein LOC100391669 isoform X7 [Callithrix jacchus]
MDNFTEIIKTAKRLFLMHILPKNVPSCGLGLPVTVTSPLSFCGPAVPPCHKAVPAQHGAPLSDRHFPGGWHPHVVPVEGPVRLHRHHLELQLPAGLVRRLPQLAGTADWLRPGVKQEVRAVRLLRPLWNHSSADDCLQHFMGLEVFDEEPGPGRRPVAAPSRISF